MPEKYDEYEAYDKLNLIAEKLKEIDRIFQNAYPHFTPEVIEMIDKADPKNEIDAGYWAKQIKTVADAIIEERMMKDDAAFDSAKSQPEENDLDAPSL